jgi:hypothetical protein
MKDRFPEMGAVSVERGTVRHMVGVVISSVTAMVLATSAGMKLRRHRICLETFETCRLPLSWLPRLAVLEGAAAAGIVVGLWWPPIGIAAASGAVIYFLVAVAAHLRVGDWNGWRTAVDSQEQAREPGSQPPAGSGPSERVDAPERDPSPDGAD